MSKVLESTVEGALAALRILLDNPPKITPEAKEAAIREYNERLTSEEKARPEGWYVQKLLDKTQAEVVDLLTFLNDIVVSLEGDLDGAPDANGRAKLAGQITHDIAGYLASRGK